MKLSIPSLVLLILMTVGSPVLGQEPTPQAATGMTDVTLPPELDRVLRDYENAWRAGDAKALASLFAEDGFVLQSNAPPVRGRTAIEAAYKGQGGSPLQLRALAFGTGDTNGFIIGAYRYGMETHDMGKFTLTLRRTPGGPWLIFSDMDNSSRPLIRNSL